MVGGEDEQVSKEGCLTVAGGMHGFLPRVGLDLKFS